MYLNHFSLANNITLPSSNLSGFIFHSRSLDVHHSASHPTQLETLGSLYSEPTQNTQRTRWPRGTNLTHILDVASSLPPLTFFCFDDVFYVSMLYIWLVLCTCIWIVIIMLPYLFPFKVTCLQLCGNRIVSGSDDNTLRVWNATSGKVHGTARHDIFIDQW